MAFRGLLAMQVRVDRVVQLAVLVERAAAAVQEALAVSDQSEQVVHKAPKEPPAVTEVPEQMALTERYEYSVMVLRVRDFSRPMAHTLTRTRNTPT